MLSIKDIKRLLEGFRCSCCFSDFGESSFSVMRFDEGLFVLKLTCENCGKSFGIAFLGLNEEELLNSSKGCPEKNNSPISFDDVINAHKYIQNLDENWRSFITDKKREH